MHGIGAGDLAGGQQAWNVEIALGSRRRADAHALVGQAHVHGVGIRGGMHGDRRNAELFASPLNAQRDLTPVRDQDLVEHVCPSMTIYSMMTSGSPNSTGWPFSKRIAVTVPDFGAGIWFIVFMASMISSVSPADTLLPTSMNTGADGSGAL